MALIKIIVILFCILFLNKHCIKFYLKYITNILLDFFISIYLSGSEKWKTIEC